MGNEVFLISERCFNASENFCGIKTVRFFGERLLHVELQTEYGKREVVCGEKGILNHFMLKSFSDENGPIERNSFYCSYSIEGETVLISLEDKEHKENPKNQLWTIDPVLGLLTIALESGLSKIVISLDEVTENNG